MFARSRAQLRLLLFTCTAIAALAIPGTALAAPATLDMTAPAGGPDEGVTFTSPYEGAAYEYYVGNGFGGDDATVNTRIEVEYATAELRSPLVQTNQEGALDCTEVEVGGTTTVTCPIQSIAGGDAIIVMVDVELADGFTGSTTTLMTSVFADGTSDSITDTTNWDYAPRCSTDGSYYSTTTTRSQAATDGEILVDLATCTDPDGGAVTFTPIVGDTGTLSPSGTNARYVPNGTVASSPSGFAEYFTVTLEDGEGDTTTAYVYVQAFTQSDVSSTLTGPSAFAVPAAGGTVTYTNTIRNAGPDTIGGLFAGWEIPSSATLVSATLGGAAVTCETGYYGGEGFVAYGCGSGELPAVGASTTATITLRFAAGEKGLVLPSTVNVAASAWPNGQGGAEDPAAADNSRSMTTALSVPVATTGGGTSGTQTIGADLFIGGTADDVFAGGAGDDVFRMGAGNDRAYGGPGNDAAFGDVGNDLLVGGRGNDRLNGGHGADRIQGGAGRDNMFGGTGPDTVNGGSGNDTVRGGTGADRVFCGHGTDIAYGNNGMDLIGCRDGRGGDVLAGGYGLDTCVGDTRDRFISCEVVIRL